MAMVVFEEKSSVLGYRRQGVMAIAKAAAETKAALRIAKRRFEGTSGGVAGPATRRARSNS
jgi:hypothetical protein